MKKINILINKLDHYSTNLLNQTKLLKAAFTQQKAKYNNNYNQI